MELEDKSSSYLFWLSEYLARKLLVNIGPNAAMLLRFFEIGESANKGLLEDIEYQPTPKDVAVFIKSGTWKVLDAEWMQRFEPLLHKIPDMQEEIDSLSAYIAANEEEIRLAMSMVGSPMDADIIINSYLAGRLPKIMAQGFYDYAHAFICATVVAHDSGGRQMRVGLSDLEIQGDVLRIHNVSIDLAANMDDILADIADIVCYARSDAAYRDGAEEQFMGETDIEGVICPGYGPCTGGRCQKREEHSLEAKIRRKAESGGYAYSPRSDNARAVGLWLWDYIRGNGCSVNTAIRAIRAQGFLEPLQYSASHDRVFERFHARTRACIEQGKVLSVR